MPAFIDAAAAVRRQEHTQARSSTFCRRDIFPCFDDADNDGDDDDDDNDEDDDDNDDNDDDDGWRLEIPSILLDIFLSNLSFTRWA